MHVCVYIYVYNVNINLVFRSIDINQVQMDSKKALLCIIKLEVEIECP